MNNSGAPQPAEADREIGSVMKNIRNLGRQARNLGMRLRHPRRKQLTAAEEEELAAVQSSKEILMESIQIIDRVPKRSRDASADERKLYK